MACAPSTSLGEDDSVPFLAAAYDLDMGSGIQ